MQAAIGSVAVRVRTIPLDRSLFVREMPSREMPWEVPADMPAGKKVVLEFDVSSLIRRSGDYRVIPKWMLGGGPVGFKDVELYLDGERVAKDRHVGVTGDVRLSMDNLFSLTVDQSRFRPGRWLLRATAWRDASEPLDRPGSPNSASEGVLLVEEDPWEANRPEDFVGRWEYRHNGYKFTRVVRPDSAGSIYRDGTKGGDFTWQVVDGILVVHFPTAKSTQEHMLRDRNTLIFIDRPYRNAIMAR